MRIDFEHMTENTVEHFKGGDGTFVNKMFQDDHNKIMLAHLTPGSSIGLHTHETNSEIIYILSGAGKVLYDGQEIALSAGDCHYCPKGHQHSLINNGQEDLHFFAVVPEHGA